jgi:hypothetical protein
MKTCSILGLLAALFLSGCGKSSSSTGATNEVSSGNPITAPVDYLAAVAQAQRTAIKQIDLAYVNQALQQFNAGEDRYPKDLDELVAKGYLHEIPKAPYGYKITYDATTGAVKVVKQ